MRPTLFRPALCVTLFLSGCAFEDPLTRAGLWHPVGANDANLAAMVADPDDLVTGMADGRADGQVVAAAVAHYRAGKVKNLPDSSIAKVGAAAPAAVAPAATVAE